VFSSTLLAHFEAPQNVGEMEDADAESEEENPVCGDRVHVWLRIRDGAVQRMTWRAEGCAPAIAAASATSVLVEGMALDRVRALGRDEIVDALDGLPPRKTHAAVLALDALRRALELYDAGSRQGSGG
jgi:nitrogen fixation NifU-like protein